MRSLIIASALLIVVPAGAQAAPKVVKTHRVEVSPTPLYRIEDDGVVRVDWRQVEAVARSADLTDRDVARALLAVRDGTAQPMR